MKKHTILLGLLVSTLLLQGCAAWLLAAPQGLPRPLAIAEPWARNGMTRPSS